MWQHLYEVSIKVVRLTRMNDFQTEITHVFILSPALMAYYNLTPYLLVENKTI